MAPLVSGVLLVLDASQVPRGVEERVKGQLDRAGANVLGSVVTKVRPDLVDSYVYRERYHEQRPRRAWSPGAAATAALGLAMVVGSFIAGTHLSLPAGPRHGLADVVHTVARLMSTFSRP